MNKRRWTLAILAFVVLIIAGCDNAPAKTNGNANDTAAPVATDTGSGTAAPMANGNGDGGGDNTADPSAQGIKFADCMRKNGVREFPDPDASGNLTIENIVNGSSLDTESAAFKRAIDACQDLQPAGFTGGNRSPEQQQAALEFAQCIRDNGVKDFPDPANGEPLVDTNRIPSANRPGGMSLLNAAMEKCGGLAGDAGVTGGQ